MRDIENVDNNIPCWQTVVQALLSISVTVNIWLLGTRKFHCTELNMTVFQFVQRRAQSLLLTWICYFFTILHQAPSALMFSVDSRGGCLANLTEDPDRWGGKTSIIVPSTADLSPCIKSYTANQIRWTC